MSGAPERAEPDRHPHAPHPREAPRLYGHGRAEAALADALAAGRMHHAWLLRGRQGIGKATLAYRIARRLIAGGPAEALDWPADCPIGRRIRAGSEARLAVLSRGLNEKTGRPRMQIGIDEVRAARRFLDLSAVDGGWRAVIVDAADELTANAANALLKSLEEPPARTAFLLVAHAPAGLLPTIRSRCRMLDLAPLSEGDLAAALVQAGHEPPGEMAALAELSAGSVGRAITLLADGGLEIYASLVALAAGGRIDRAGLSELADGIAGRDRERRFAATAEMTLSLVGRLARAGALGPPPVAVVEAEPALMCRVAAGTAQARLWAEAAARIAGVYRHAVAVNLDPAQTILDIFLDLDQTLAAASGHA